MPGGEDNSKRGYMLSFVVAYLRVRTSSLAQLHLANSFDDWVNNV